MSIFDLNVQGFQRQFVILAVQKQSVMLLDYCKLLGQDDYSTSLHF